MTANATLANFHATYGDHYIAVNEEGRLRLKPPMRPSNLKFSQAIQQPINAGLASKHLVFFIHGGLNDLDVVTNRIESYDKVFANEPWHLIHLAWDTSYGSSIDDMLFSFHDWRSWQNLRRLTTLFNPRNWFGYRRILRSPLAYFGSIAWKSQYETALAATRLIRITSGERDFGFYKAFQYLNSVVQDGDGVQISFVVHSAGSLVANYLLGLMNDHFPNLKDRIRNYILLAPACHLSQFEKVMSQTTIQHPAVCMTLTRTQEATDGIGPVEGFDVYEKSLLWAIHDLFEANWKASDYDNFRIPMKPNLEFRSLENTAILGIEGQIADLEQRSPSSFDRTLEGKVEWTVSDRMTAIRGDNRIWTTSDSHGGFDRNESVRVSLQNLLR